MPPAQEPPQPSLAEFVEQTLIDISNGVNSAYKGHMKPRTDFGLNFRIGGVDDYERLFNIYNREVEFDVAVTVSSDSQQEVKAGIFIAPFGIGGSETTGAESSSVTRIKFSVPISLPNGEEVSAE